MTPIDFKEQYARELDELHKEISAYSDETKLWLVKGEIKNSPANLCLHLLGNVKHFIGATLGNTGYIRNRDQEFALKNISKEKLLTDIIAGKAMVEKVLSSMTDSDLQKDFPVELIGKRSTEYMLCYFLAHFKYHLGQINYHRRFI